MSSATFYTGDVLQVLAKLHEASVDLVLTSPPFLALRSYLPADHPDKRLEGGSQSRPGEFVDWLLDVVEACDRVLAPHGSMCFELGDTFAGSGGGGGDYYDDGLRAGQPGFTGSAGASRDALRDANAAHWRLKQEQRDAWPADKSLALIPETFRFALAYGFNPHTGRKTTPWRIRNVIRWVRPNPPVGALGDKFRPATSEMVVFCRTDEAGRKRYFDLDAVREPHKHGVAVARGSYSKGPTGNRRGGGDDAFGEDVRDIELNPAGGPPLDWWNIPTHPYKGAHYATWPPELCLKPIKAMSPERVCLTCGEPSRRVVGEPEYVAARQAFTDDTSPGRGFRDANDQRGMSGTKAPAWKISPTLGWTSCNHDNWRPGTVLDPFAGSGTTLAVAIGHGRNAIGIDLDGRNVELARERVGPMFFEEGVL